MATRASLAIVLLATAAVALGLGATRSEDAREPSIMRVAQANCPEQCRASYGQCMKASANRATCQAQLDACLKACSAAKGAK